MTTSPLASYVTMIVSWLIAGCTRPEPPPAPETSAAEPAPVEDAAVAPEPKLALVQRTFDFDFPRTSDMRPKILRVTALVPEGGGWRVSKLADLMEFGLDEADLDLTFMTMCVEGCRPGSGPMAIARQEERLIDALGSGAAVTRPQAPAAGWSRVLVDKPGGGRAASVSLVPDGGEGMALSCTARSSREARPAALARLEQSCGEMKVEVLEPTLPADLLRREEGLLARCAAVSSVELVRGEAAAEGEPQTFGPVGAVRANLMTGGRVRFHLANWERSDWDLAGDPSAPEQLQLSFEVTPPADTFLASGIYTRAGGERHGVTMAVLEQAAAPRSLMWDEKASLEVEILARTHDRICARFAFEGAKRRVTGALVAPLTVGAP